MNQKEMIAACAKIISTTNQCEPEYDVAVFALSQALSGQQKDALTQLVEKGPLYDGDLISKSARTDLLEMGLISKAIVKGEEGYQVANYHGFAVHRARAKLI
jgi:hypothetical protein